MDNQEDNNQQSDSLEFVTSKDPQKKPKEELLEDLSVWEELKDDNSVVKKYLFYISKDFIPLLDKMNKNERSAYINDAIQIKLDFLSEKKKKMKKIEALIHLIIILTVIILSAPYALLRANKTIMMTFDNYKYSQDNFEKLYKNHIEKSKFYLKSLDYNKKKN